MNKEEKKQATSPEDAKLDVWYEQFKEFVGEFKDESDRAAVILEQFSNQITL